MGDEGVTVVVDFTDSGGDIEVACAEGSPENGRAALETAGFVPEDSQPGMICAIDSSPDPCPEEFDGNYWSYWFANDAGEWESYQVGADEADPAPGAVEGWRYFDGSEGPQVEAAALVGGNTDEAADEPEAEENPSEEGTDAESGASEDSSVGVWIGAIAAVAVVGGIIATLVRRRNQDEQLN